MYHCDVNSTEMHCSAWSLPQCNGCKRYQSNDGPDYGPHYSVPAIPLQIHHHLSGLISIINLNDGAHYRRTWYGIK